jgi:hypothetical protein
MKAISKAALALLFAANAAAFAAEPPVACASDPAAHGMRERMDGMREQMDRIEHTSAPGERRALMDLHMKRMHEGMRTLRDRGAGDRCRIEFMQAMMEQMMRHELALREEER